MLPGAFRSTTVRLRRETQTAAHHSTVIKPAWNIVVLGLLLAKHRETPQT
jgi:hypothetical protein